MKNRAVIFVIICFLCVFVCMSCAKTAPVAPHLVQGKATSRSEALGDYLKNFGEKTKLLRAFVNLEISDGNGTRATDAAFVVERPDRIRIDAIDSLADVWASVGSDGARPWIFLAAKKKLYTGKAIVKHIEKIVWLRFDVPELISVLSGLPYMSHEVLQAGSNRDRHFISGNMHVWLSSKGNNVEKCVRYADDEKTIEYSATFSNYALVNGVKFPRRVEVMFPGRGANIVMEYKDVDFPGNIEPKVFAPREARANSKTLKGRT